jgi:hypothetical protein
VPTLPPLSVNVGESICYCTDFFNILLIGGLEDISFGSLGRNNYHHYHSPLLFKAVIYLALTTALTLSPSASLPPFHPPPFLSYFADSSLLGIALPPNFAWA